MAFDSLADPQLLRGLVFALAGVGFWVGGILAVNWLWNHYRGGEDSRPEGKAK